MAIGGERSGSAVRMAACALAAVLALTAFVAASCGGTPKPVTLLGLGDSFSSGEGTSRSEGDCGRSTSAYPELVAADLEERGQLAPSHGSDAFEFVACSGAEVPDVAEQIEALQGRRFDVVTLTVGGNDVGFRDVLIDCVGADDVVGSLLKGDLDQFLDRGCELDQTDASARIDRLRGELVSLYARISDEVLTDDGTLVVLGYPQLFADPADWDASEGTRCDGFAVADVDLLRAATEELNQAIEAATEESDHAVFVDQSDAFENHGRCSRDPWLNGFTVRPRLLSSFHPDESGHLASAALVLAAIGR